MNAHLQLETTPYVSGTYTNIITMQDYKKYV
jgi:hypothetical protein